MAKDKCLIERKGECIMKDETAIVLAVGTTVSALLALPLFSILSQIPKR